MRKVFVGAVALVGAAAVNGMAQGAVMTQSGSIPMQTTNWTETFEVDQFDTVGGTRVLEDVTWTFEGVLEGFAAAESLDAEPSTVTLDLSAVISVFMGGDGLEAVCPAMSETFHAAAFDDVLDFAGPSGASFGPLEHTDQRTGSPIDVSAWIGTGELTLTGVAFGSAIGAGSGNLATDFALKASLNWQVSYRFSEIPGPGSAALLGIAGLCAAGRRRAR